MAAGCRNSLPPLYCATKMNMFNDTCPKCKSGKGLSRLWVTWNGREARTCFCMNQPDHLGLKHHFYTDTGEPIGAGDAPTSRILSLLSAGGGAPLRDYPGDFLREKCALTVIKASDLDTVTASSEPHLGLWARKMEASGHMISQLPITKGSRCVGVQFRALEIEGDTQRAVKEIRNFKSADGLYIPPYTSWNPSAVVIHEGPWGAVAATWEAQEYGSFEIFSVAILSASVSVATVASTLDLIFPGVPRFTLTDQDPAGVVARETLLPIATPIMITGAGPGKDYRDLIPGLRFERLSEALRIELKRLDGVR